MRSIGTSVSSAVIGMVLAHTSARMGPALVPSVDGFRISFVIATGAVVIGLVLAAFLPSQTAAMRPRLQASSSEDAQDSVGFRGAVQDADGAPVPRANVTLIDLRGRQAGLTTTDEEGRYALAAPAAGGYVLAGSASAHAPCAHPVAYGGDGIPVEIDLVLTAGAAAGLLRSAG